MLWECYAWTNVDFLPFCLSPFVLYVIFWKSRKLNLSFCPYNKETFGLNSGFGRRISYSRRNNNQNKSIYCILVFRGGLSETLRLNGTAESYSEIKMLQYWFIFNIFLLKPHKSLLFGYIYSSQCLMSIKSCKKMKKTKKYFF